MKTDFLTPVGRLVQGDPFEAQTKNQQGQPLVTLSGQPTQKYFIAVAFPKNDPAFPALHQKLKDVARSGWPNLFDAAGNCTHPRFSWKLVDGDGVDDNGKSNASKPCFAGHWVVKFASSFAPRCFHVGHYAPHEQIQDPKAIQRGYMVRVSGTIEPNTNINKPGIYVNLNMVELSLARPDLIITTGPDAAAVFGSPQHQPPASVGAAPAMPIFPPSTVATAAPSPSNPAFLMPVPPPAHTMTPKAAGGTYEQFIAQGWTDQQMRAEGYVV